MGNTDSKSETKVDVINVIQNNKNTINILNKKIIHSEKRLINEMTGAKICLQSKNKKKALLHLKRKKMLQKQIDNLHGQIMNLEQQSITLEGLTMNHQVVDTMKITSNAMKNLNKNMDVDKVDNLISDIQEHIEDIEEVNQILSNPLDNSNLIDEDELLSELDDLMSEEQQVETGKEYFNLPEVPENIVINQEQHIELDNSDENKALEKLEKLMI